MRRARLVGGVIGFGMGMSLLLWALIVDVVHLPFTGGGADADGIRCAQDQGIASTDCRFVEGLAEVGRSVGDQMEAAVYAGTFIATVILVLSGVAVGGWIARRRLGLPKHGRAAPRATSCQVR
jgi:hypothetical protein